MSVSLPLCDVSRQYDRCRDAIDRGIREVMSSGQYILGPVVEQFETAFARYLGARHGIGVASGLDALRLVLQALDVKEGAEVIVPANTFAATALAVQATGARVVPVEVDPGSSNLTAEAASQAITPRTKAIIPVHLYGRTCDMEPILELARQRGLFVIEDACQAHGALAGDRRAGTLGQAGCFSFYPTKNLGAAGDGGFIVTNDDALAEKVRFLRNYGQRVRYEHEAAGTNSRLDSLQAAILLAKLPHLEEWNAERVRLAKLYCERLRPLDVVLPMTPITEGSHVYHLFVVRHRRRDALAALLAARNIGCGIHYPIPIHKQPFFHEAEVPFLPVTETLCREVLSLPLFPGMLLDEVDAVVSAVRHFDRG